MQRGPRDGDDQRCDFYRLRLTGWRIASPAFDAGSSSPHQVLRNARVWSPRWAPGVPIRRNWRRRMRRLARLLKNDDPSVAARMGYLYVPVVVSTAAFAVSLAFDLCHPGKHWLGRSGAIIALCGGVSGYGGAVRIWIRRGSGGEHIVGIYSEIPYGKVGLVLGLLGTILWGYGDLWL